MEVVYVKRCILDELESLLFEAVCEGGPVPTGSDDKNIMNALTRLRRNGFIKNIGSRTKPHWVLGDDPPRLLET